MTARLVYDIPEAAELLGVSPDTIYRLISSGALRRCDIRTSGKRPRTRIRHEDLVAFLDARTVA